MMIKQIVLDKNEKGDFTGATFHYWDKTPPAIFFFNPPIEMPHLLVKLFEGSKKSRHKAKHKGKRK